jgi:hypothetical protein
LVRKVVNEWKGWWMADEKCVAVVVTSIFYMFSMLA